MEKLEKVNLKDKVCCVVDNGLFVEISLRLAKDFKEVLYFTEWRSSFPSKRGVMVGEGLEGITRINNLFEVIDKVDVFVFPDCYDGDLQTYLRQQGKFVFGGGNGDELELWRAEAKVLFKKLGLPVNPYKVIIGLDTLRSHLKKVENKFIKISCYRGEGETFHHQNYFLSEPILDLMESKMGAMKYDYEFIVENAIDGDDIVEAGTDLYTIDGQYPKNIISGFEIKDLGYIGAVNEFAKLSPLITDYNIKIADTLKEYQYRGFMSSEIRVGKDKIPYMIDACFSDDTEVLTNNGWKLFKDCIVEDKFATMNTNKEIEYQFATDVIINDYDGKMILLSNDKKSIECLITPNHHVLRYDRDKKELFKEQADSLTDRGFIPRTGVWNGNSELEYFELPEYHKEWDFTSNRALQIKKISFGTKEIKVKEKTNYVISTKVKHEEAIKIPLKDWADFLGWYISEGSTSNEYVTQIAQIKFVDEVKQMLDKLPFEYSYNGTSFRISSVQLTSYLKQYGLCDKKFIPNYIKESNPEIIRTFLNAFNLGDGSRHKGNLIYYTTSKQLADDLQECIFKIGSVSNITFKEIKGTIMKVKDGKEYIRNHNSYTLTEHNTFNDFYFETQSRKKQYINEVDYNGKVYCMTVPNGTLYVRRNGKPFWSSNCQRSGSPPNELYQEMIENLGEIVWYGSQGIMIEPIYKAKYGIEVLIHSDWASDNWQSIRFPEKIRQWVKLRNACKIKGTYYIVPQSDGLPEIGAVVAIGDSVDECIKKVTEYSEQIEGYRLDIKLGSIENMKEVVEKAAKLGIKSI